MTSEGWSSSLALISFQHLLEVSVQFQVFEHNVSVILESDYLKSGSKKERNTYTYEFAIPK